MVLNEFEQMLLLTALRLGTDAGDVQVWREVQRRSGQEVARTAVTAALDRLGARGAVIVLPTEPVPDPAAGRRRLVTVTPVGIAALRECRRVHEQFWAGIDLEEADHV